MDEVPFFDSTEFVVVATGLWIFVSALIVWARIQGAREEGKQVRYGRTLIVALLVPPLLVGLRIAVYGWLNGG